MDFSSSFVGNVPGPSILIALSSKYHFDLGLWSGYSSESANSGVVCCAMNSFITCLPSDHADLTEKIAIV